jgi:hypothetical protein
VLLLRKRSLSKVLSPLGAPVGLGQTPGGVGFPLAAGGPTGHHRPATGSTSLINIKFRALVEKAFTQVPGAEAAAGTSAGGSSSHHPAFDQRVAAWEQTGDPASIERRHQLLGCRHLLEKRGRLRRRQAVLDQCRLRFDAPVIDVVTRFLFERFDARLCDLAQLGTPLAGGIFASAVPAQMQARTEPLRDAELVAPRPSRG